MERIILPAGMLALAIITACFLFTTGGLGALLIVLITAMLGLALFRQFSDDKQFVTMIFVGALAARLVFGFIVHALDLRDFFGGDANTYDNFGNELLLRWTGAVSIPNPVVDYRLNDIGSGWGMYDLVAAIYYVLGRNILAAQSFCAVIGASTAPMASG